MKLRWTKFENPTKALTLRPHCARLVVNGWKDI